MDKLGSFPTCTRTRARQNLTKPNIAEAMQAGINHSTSLPKTWALYFSRDNKKGLAGINHGKVKQH